MTTEVTKSIIVGREVGDVYGLWSDFTNFPRFMEHIVAVDPIDGDRTHWVMRGPAGRSLEWDAETTRMEANDRIAWKSVGGDIQTSGQVTFKELPDAQTEVRVTLHYQPPTGKLGAAAAALFGQPDRQLTEDLLHFKAMAEGMEDRLPE